MARQKRRPLQRQLYDALKEIPLVGKPIAEMAEAAGAALAHAFGNESTADIEAGEKHFEDLQKAMVAAAKEATKELQEEADKRDLIGLTGEAREQKRAEQGNRSKIEQQRVGLRDALAANAERAQAVKDAQKELNDSLAAQELGKRDYDPIGRAGRAQSRQEDVEAARQKLLDAKQRAAESQAAVDEIQRSVKSLQTSPAADAKAEADAKAAAGGKSSGGELFKGLLDVGKSAWAKLIDGAKAYGEEQKRLKEEGLRMWEETLTPGAALSTGDRAGHGTAQGGGDHAAAVQGHPEQRAKANQRGTGRSQEDLHQTALDVLRQEADLGDKAAEKELKKIELQDRYLEQKKKLLAIEQSTTSTADEKKQAAALLADLDSMQGKEPAEKKKKDQTVGPADLEVSQYLTGVWRGPNSRKRSMTRSSRRRRNRPES